MRVLIKRVIFYALLIVAWAFVAQLKIWPEYLFPSPQGVWESLRAGFVSHDFLRGIGTSLQRLLLGYFLSIAVGLPLGVLLARYRTLDETLGSLVAGIQALPSICWLPLALLWFGLNDAAIVFVIMIGSTLAITVATTSGVKQVAPLYLRAARTLGARRFKLYFHVVLPASLPAVVAGLKQGWSFAWRSLMAGEMLFGNLGLGYLLNMGRELNDLSQVLAVMIVIVGVVLVIDRVVFNIIDEKIKERWGFNAF